MGELQEKWLKVEAIIRVQKSRTINIQGQITEVDGVQIARLNLHVLTATAATTISTHCIMEV